MKTEKDSIIQDDLYRNRIVYSSPVRIDNWNNEKFIVEEKEKINQFKRDHCQYLVVKTKAMLRNVLEPVALAPERDNVEYNEVYQIVACELPNSLSKQDPVQKGLYLSCIMNEKDLDFGTNFMHGCGITGSPTSTCYMRNTFVFISADNKSGILNYGDNVYIQVNGIRECPLYVQCESSTFDNFGAHLTVRLSQIPDIYCLFKFLHWDPSVRHESLGTGVKPYARVIINHTASGRNLAAEHHNWIPTFFGPECAVTCHTFRDTHRMETIENIWRIQSRKSGNKTVIKQNDCECAN